MLAIDIFAPLLELRRNPHLNPKVSMLDALQKYAGRNAFVSFTEDVGSISHGFKDGAAYGHTARGNGLVKGAHNTRGAKLGINPQSSYDTPLGIYAYPVDYVLEKSADMEFAKYRPYLWVFEPAGKMLDLATYSSSDLQSDAKAIRMMGPDGDDAVRLGARDATTQTPGGKIWNITRYLAIEEAGQRLRDKAADGEEEREEAAFQEFLKDRWPDMADEDEEDDEDAAREAFLQDYVDEEAYPEDEEKQKAAAPYWNRIFRELGYAGVMDLKGAGIIHTNEKTQAVFFSRAGLKTLELIHNVKPREPLSDIEIYFKQPKALLKQVQDGRVSPEDLITLLDANPQLAPKLGFANLPAAVQDHIRNHAPEYFANAFGDWKPSDIGLNDAQTIALFRTQPGWASTFPKFSRGVRAFIISNIGMFRNYFDRLPLTPKDKEAILVQHPEMYEEIDKSNPSPFLQDFMLRHHPEDFAQVARSYTITTPNLVRYFVGNVLKSKDDYRIKEFLRYVLTLRHNVTTRKNGDPKTFLLLFSYLSDKQAMTLIKKSYPNDFGKALFMKMAGLKPAIANAIDPKRF